MLEFLSYFFECLNALFQIRAFRPSLVSVKDALSVSALREALAGMDKLPEIMCGEEGIVEVGICLSQLVWMSFICSTSSCPTCYEEIKRLKLVFPTRWPGIQKLSPLLQESSVALD